MHSTKILVVMIGVSLCLSACSNKQDKPKTRLSAERINQHYQDFIARWDKDQDGFASCKDIALSRVTVFTQLDSNKDGNLTSFEFRDIMHLDKSFRFIPFGQIDKNASGAIEKHEFTATENKIFKRYDRNDDCVISKSEFIKTSKEQSSQGKRRDGKKGKRGGNGRSKGRPPSSL